MIWLIPVVFNALAVWVGATTGDDFVVLANGLMLYLSTVFFIDDIQGED